MSGISDIVNDDNFLEVRGLGIERLHLKIEAFNASGSIKLKTARGLISDLEARGKIGPKTVLIESSSGSLGVALSIISAERGYRFKCVVDPNASAQNVSMMRALGAEVVRVEERDENGGFLGTRIRYITDLVKSDPNYLWTNQYANQENPRAHAQTTACAIFEQFEHVDYLFIGAGTTGTLVGCAQFFSRHSPKTKIIAVDCEGSVTFGGAPGRRHIPGLGTSRRPEIYVADGIYAHEMVAEVDTVAMCRHLARTNGLLCGGSTGTVMRAVVRWRDRISADANVVAISPDMGERYLDTIYDDTWVQARFGRIPAWAPDEAAVTPAPSALI
jgi:N-(2-amino-2-carboxyethyl)-L-glutamate synthase